MGVNQKMKLYNIYRICKQNVDCVKSYTIKKNAKTLHYEIDNWVKLKNVFDIICKIPSFKNCVLDYIKAVPVLVREDVSPQIDPTTAQNLNGKLKIIYNKMDTIIDLYESMNLDNGGKNGIDIKLPQCEYLDDYVSNLQDLNFIFSQCPFLRCEGEIFKFESVDVGSNWLKLTIATTTTCVLLNNVAALVDKAFILRSHYIEIQQQEEMLKSIQIKNELTKEQIETFKLIRSTYTNAAISLLENDLGELKDSEERDKAERSLEKLADLLNKGCEIYATLDSPEEIQTLFPEIQGSLELSDDIIKYIEEKE